MGTAAQPSPSLDPTAVVHSAVLFSAGSSVSLGAHECDYRGLPVTS